MKIISDLIFLATGQRCLQRHCGQAGQPPRRVVGCWVECGVPSIPLSTQEWSVKNFYRRGFYGMWSAAIKCAAFVSLSCRRPGQKGAGTRSRSGGLFAGSPSRPPEVPPVMYSNFSKARPECQCIHFIKCFFSLPLFPIFPLFSFPSFFFNLIAGKYFHFYWNAIS